MVQLGPELAPETGVSMLALASLASLTAFLIARGLVGIAVPLVEALFWPFKKLAGGIPFVGSTLKYPFTKVEQNIVHVLAVTANKLDELIAHSWHDLARLVRFLGREIEGLALELYHHAQLLNSFFTPSEFVAFLRKLLHPIRAFQEIERKLGLRDRAQTTAVRQTVTTGVFPRLKVAEGELSHVIEWDIPHLRARTKALERRVELEWKWIRARPWLIASATMAATVAVCLRRLGLGWLRCRNWRKVGPGLCGLPVSLFETLALGALGYLAVVDPVDIAKAAIKTEDLMHAFVKKVAETNG